MKLFVVGATGRTGQEIVQQALERGHHVTAFVRSLEAVNLKRERLTVLQGNAESRRRPFRVRSARGFQAELTSSRQCTCDCSRDAAFRSEAAAHSLSGSAFSRHSQSDCEFYPSKSHAGFACHGKSRARERARLDNRSSSTSYSGAIRNVSKSGRFCSRKRFHSLP